MPVGATVGATLAAGAITAGTSLLAADKQSKSADKATAVQKEMFETTRGDLAPYKNTGQSALYTLADFYGLDRAGGGQTGAALSPAALDAFRKSPDYTFARDEGISALDRSAASKGLLLSGGQTRDITKFASGLADQNIGNYLTRLYQLAGVGQSAAGATGNAALSTGRGVAETTMGAGEAEASGIVGAGNAVSGTIKSLYDNSAVLPTLRSSYAAQPKFTPGVGYAGVY